MRQVEIQLIIAKMFSLYLPYFDKKWFMSAERSLKTRQHLPFFFCTTNCVGKSIYEG